MRFLYSINRSLGAAIAAIALVAILSSALVLATLNSLREATEARGRSNQIVRELDSFRAAMLNQETGLRGYLLTGEPASLDPYRIGRAALDASVKRLRDLTANNPLQVRRINAAEQTARGWQKSIADQVIANMANPATRDRAVKIESSGDGMRRFDQFRAQLTTVQSEEERTLAAARAAVDRAQQRAAAALWISAIITLLICAGIGLAVSRLIARPIVLLTGAMGRLAQRDLAVQVPGVDKHNEVGEMARAVDVFKNSMIELDRSSLLRTTADILPALVGYIDASRRIGFLNGEFGRWFDLRAEDVSQVYGQPLERVFAADPFPGAGRELEAAFDGAETRFEHRLARRGEAKRDVEATYRPHLSPNGAVLGVVTLLTDITERKELDRRLVQQARDLLRSNEELEQFAYVASHDLKAPLRGIENLVSWIEEDLEGSLTADTRTNMDLLKSRVRRLESLLNDLLAYSRAGRGAEQFEPIDTHALIEELAGLVAPPEGFKITAAATLPTIKAARAPLTQVFQNLISNAIKHRDGASEGRVHVDARALDRSIEFIVTDDGPGIPPRFHDRVFGMFQTLKPRDEVEGSGMGLAIVKKLVERQGGKIWLEEAGEGRGLAVHFIWPHESTRSANARYGQLAAG